jgi:hypothetical protein
VITQIGGIFTIRIVKGIGIYRGGTMHHIISREYRNSDFKIRTLIIISTVKYKKFDITPNSKDDIKKLFIHYKMKTTNNDEIIKKKV